MTTNAYIFTAISTKSAEPEINLIIKACSWTEAIERVILVTPEIDTFLDLEVVAKVANLLQAKDVEEGHEGTHLRITGWYVGLYKVTFNEMDVFQI
jgi:hypothetical protein